jgi:glycosyltransferase involved in cell wall biosynthesis
VSEFPALHGSDLAPIACGVASAALPNPAPAGAPRVSIIVPVKDDPRIHSVVASLVGDRAASLEVLVADDGPPGGLSGVAGAQLVPVHGRNPGAARNAATRLARGSILLFTDADVLLPPRWVETALEAFEDPLVEAVQGNSRAAGEGSLARNVDREWKRFVLSHAATERADLCDTRCFGIRRKTFERFSFDPEDPFCEDAALGRRLFEAGVPIRFLPHWFVEHHLRRSASEELARFRRYAAASEHHFRRTGRDLFRAPDGPPPRGPGASLLRLVRRHRFLEPATGRALWWTALALARLSPVSGFFDAARRLAVLSARMSPEQVISARKATAGIRPGS